MDIILREIDINNWEECIDLEVTEEQKKFVATNSYSILQAKFEEEIYTLGIYNKDIMVGFLMYDLDPDTKRMEISRLMIDQKYQGKGYGKKSMLKLLELIKGKYGNIKFYTSIEPENIIAEKLYESIGFKKTGEIMWDEEVMTIQL